MLNHIEIILQALVGGFQIRDLLDIFIVAFFIYLLLIFFKRTKNFLILYLGIILFCLNYLIGLLNLRLTAFIFEPILATSLVIFVLAFQKDIRKFFEWFSGVGRRLSIKKKISLTSDVARQLTEALLLLSQHRSGAIIVVAGDINLDNLIDGGYFLDGKVSAALIVSIFDHHSPGHDGAILIENNRLSKFGAHLPLADNFETIPNKGTRHRAAVGITEISDALSLVVSEETGQISFALDGKLQVCSSLEEVEKIVARFMKQNIIQENIILSWRNLFFNDLNYKFLAILLAAVFWLLFMLKNNLF